MEANNFIEEISKIYEINTNIDEMFFEDKYLDKFSNPYLTLHLKNTNVKYSYKYITQSGGNYDNVKSYIDSIKKIREILKNTSIPISDIYYKYYGILYKKFYDDIAKMYNVSFDDNIYVYSVKVPYAIKKIFSSKKILLNKNITSSNISMLVLDAPDDISKKYIDEYIFIILSCINHIKHGNDVVITMFLSPWIDRMSSLYMILLNTFQNVHIIFPTFINKQKNVVYFILKNKINNVKLPEKKFSSITIDNNHKQIQDQLERFSIRIFCHLVFQYKLNVNLHILRLNNDIKYHIIKNKVLSKILD